MKKGLQTWARNAAVVVAGTVGVALPAAATDPLEAGARILKDVAEIRGLPFRQAVPMEKQTPEGLGRLMDKEMDETVRPAMAKHFDKIVRRLGLYRGPVIEDFRGMMRTVITTQVAAYYDPETKRAYFLTDGSDELETGFIYSHELYHALQDQYFDLAGYLSDELDLDSDQMLAREAVVEGEATYAGILWTVRQMSGGIIPPHSMMAPAIAMQADLDISDMRDMVSESAEDTEAVEDIPPFILELLIGNYMKGLAFVFAVQEQGWPAVEKLYKEYPPQSTEQILHPQKWLAREGAAKFTWPDFARQRVLRNWELIDDDVIGEIQWRIIFKANGAPASDAQAAADGWNGDRYAVFKRKGNDDTLLLLRTSWDSEAEAAQFTEAYRRALLVKYKDAAEPVAVEQKGSEVFIVEGGSQEDLQALLSIVRQLKATRS